jgi:hypothetical protein
VTAASTPADFVQVWATYTRKEFEMVSEQSRTLTELTERFTTQSMQPIARSASQFMRGS